MAKHEDFAELKFLKALRRSNTLTSFHGLLLRQTTLDDYKSKFCQGCSKEKINPRFYFGQEFCGECVGKWMLGLK